MDCNHSVPAFPAAAQTGRLRPAVEPEETAMSLTLAGKTAFVTAAGQGIGRAIARAFAEAGATVIATDLDAAKTLSR
jgi:S-adenosylhomocysteine hydrolase